MTGNLDIRLGRVTLKNPVICGSGEHVMTEAGLRSGLEAGAAVVIAKSFNEVEAAKDQLDRTDYRLLGPDWSVLDWDFAPPPGATLACRSGLIRDDFDDWLATIARLDQEAAQVGSYVAASIIRSDLDAAVAMAKKVDAAGVRILEFNIGTPYGDEAGGAVSTERAADAVTAQLRAVAGAVSIPVWAKITGQSENVAALAEAARAGGADAVVLMGRYLGMVPDIETRAPMLGTNLGVGGGWALPMTCYWLAKAREALGPDAPLIGTNGARNGLDTVRMLLAGARAVEYSTAVFTAGFDVLREAVEAVETYLGEHGLDAEDLVGQAADQVRPFTEQELRPGYWREFVPDGGL